ncbi:hypothetical protein METP3_02823 [Methanosarcinales archaeon]|nr:hypothetical protein METP3_02823 [Methanosarcinales archaeon]
MIGSTEMILIFGVIVLLFGASKLPELARSMGKATGEFKRAQRETELEMRRLDEPIRQEAGSISQNVQKFASDLNIKTEGKLHE